MTHYDGDPLDHQHEAMGFAPDPSLLRGETPEEYARRIAEHKARRGRSKKAKKRHQEEVGQFEAMTPEEIYEALCQAANGPNDNSYARHLAKMALSYIHRI